MRTETYHRMTGLCVVAAIGSALGFDAAPAYWKPYIGLIGVAAGAVAAIGYFSRVYHAEKVPISRREKSVTPPQSPAVPTASIIRIPACELPRAAGMMSVDSNLYHLMGMAERANISLHFGGEDLPVDFVRLITRRVEESLEGDDFVFSVQVDESGRMTVLDRKLNRHGRNRPYKIPSSQVVRIDSAAYVACAESGVMEIITR